MNWELDCNLLNLYLRHHSKPVEWVYWWTEAKGPSRKKLTDVLFVRERSRDFRKPSVRRNVVKVILEDPALSRMAWKQVSIVLDGVCKQTSDSMKTVSVRDHQRSIREIVRASFWSMIRRRRKEKTIPWGEARKRLRVPRE